MDGIAPAGHEEVSVDAGGGEGGVDGGCGWWHCEGSNFVVWNVVTSRLDKSIVTSSGKLRISHKAKADSSSPPVCVDAR